MAYDRQLTKAISVKSLVDDTTFENFASLTLIDSGGADGFQIAGEDGVFGSVPTGIVVNIGMAGIRPCTKCTVKATTGKTLAVTAILYQ